MPSRRNKTKTALTKTQTKVAELSSTHIGFIPMVVLVLFLWFTYRSVFHFPVWFDEIFGKAIFFGFPVWAYITVAGFRDIVLTFDFSKMKRGLLRGLAVGGVFGFILSIFAVYKKGLGVTPAAFFESDGFWWEFFLALMTSFWETLFFYSFIMTVVQEKYRSWPLVKQILLVALFFLIFHVPNSILRFSGIAIVYQLILLFLFSLGQAFLFASEKNGYTLLLSQAIWGMVLLVQLS